VLLALGTKLSSRVSQVITAIKVAVVLLVIIAGIGYIKASNYVPFVPDAASTHTEGHGLKQSLFSVIVGGGSSSYGIFGLLAAASIVFFAFIGFDIVATTAEETRNPRKDVPRGIIASLVIVTILYVATSLVVTGMVRYTQLKTGPDGVRKTLADAFALNGADWVAGIISVGALAGLTTVVMVLLLGQSRVLFAMSRDGLMPRLLAKTGARGTPVRITVVVGVIVLLIAGFAPAAQLEEVVNVGTLFAFTFVSAGVMVLRRKRPDLERGFRVPLMPVVPILAIAACLWLMLNLAVETWLFFLCWTVIGLLVFFAYGRRHSVVGRQRESVAAGGSVAE
jgi:APA family basic amino acid/polyamine antiporter